MGVSMLLLSCTSPKTGYVDLFRLVNEFELQEEYSAEARKEFERARTAIDSVVQAEKLKNPAASEQMRKLLYNDFSQKTEIHNKEIEKMVWTRLNPYISDFGKEKGYQYIWGATGSGNVLYADKSEDLTDEIIKYANNRYHDRN